MQKLQSRTRRAVLWTILACAPILGVAACAKHEGPAEKAGKAVDKAAGDVKDAAKDVADDVKDAVDKDKKKDKD